MDDYTIIATCEEHGPEIERVKAESPGKAATAARDRLRSRGVKDVEICWVFKGELKPEDFDFE